MSETQNNICIINAQSGIGTSSPQISRFTHNFSTVKFIVDKDFSEYAVVIITNADGNVNIVAEGEQLVKSYDAESKQTHLLWYPQREVTCDSGVVVYQIAAYDTGSEKSVWYSKEGRLIVTDSIDTTDLSTELIGASPNLITQILTVAKGMETGLQKAEENIAATEGKVLINTDSIARLTEDYYLYKTAVHSGEENYNPQSNLSQSGKAVAQAVAKIVNSAPETLDTLEELAKALGNDPNFATTIMTLLGGKVEKDTYNADADYNNQRLSDIEDNINYHNDNVLNPHRVTKDQVGLSEVDNTSDINKPVSDAMKTELNKKVDKEEGKGLSSNDFTDEYKGLVEEHDESISHLQLDLDSKADKMQGYGLMSMEPTKSADADINIWAVIKFGSKPTLEDGSTGIGDEVNVYSVEGANDRFSPRPITAVPSTLESNKQYNFGEVTELNLVFPTVATDGDVIYLTFESGATPTALTIDTTNTCDIEVIPEANTGYEIFGKYNGSIWVVNYSEYTVSEV